MKFSIVIPCYNEEKDILFKVDVLKQYLKEKEYDSEIILVNDGSKDKTKEIINNIKNIKAISYDTNRGKGGAVKEGIKEASGEYIIFMDADLSTDLSAIDIVNNEIESYDIMIGSRHIKGSNIKKKQPLSRQFIGWCCRVIMKILFGFKYKDTQCGFKAFKSSVAKDIISKQTITDFAFDIEYLYIAKLNKYSVKEFPVIWSDDRGSTVSPIKSSIRFFKDAFKIRKNKKNYIKKEN